MCLTIWNRRDLFSYSTVLNMIPNYGKRILSFDGFHGVASWTDSFALLSKRLRINISNIRIKVVRIKHKNQSQSNQH